MKSVNKNNPYVIVLILSYNGKSLLDDSVSSYLANDYPNFKVAVIDNGSSDNTKEYVEEKFEGVTVLKLEKNLGYSGGFNYGLEWAFKKLKADYVLVTNNDVKVDKGVISALVNTAEKDHKIGFVTGKVYYYEQPNILQTVGKKEDPILWNGGHIGWGEEDKGQYEDICERYFADDVFTLVKKDVYMKIGGYDTTFQFQSEEYDWQARAKQFGYKIYYTPKAKIWHKDSMTIGRDSPFKAYYNSRNPMIVIIKHRSPEDFRKYFWFHLKSSVFKNSVKRTKKFRFLTAFKIWQGFFSGLTWGFKNKKFTYNHFLK